MKNKIKKIFFPEKGKENIAIRLYIVIIYLLFILSILYSFFININNAFYQAKLLTVNDVDREFSWALLDPSINSNTVSIFVNENISGSKRITNFEKYQNGYEYKIDLIYNIIPKLAEENSQLSNNIYKVRDIFNKNIESYTLGREKIHLNIYYIIIDIFIYIVLLIIPIFIFFRSVFYRVLLYIIYGKKSNDNSN